MSKKSRGWCFTLNNYTEEEKEKLLKVEAVYKILGLEVGEKGTPHIQGYFYFKNARALGGLKKINKRMHLEIANGTPEDNKNYCSKENNFIEIGEMPKQGKRNDLIEIKNKIMEGKKVEDLILENPNIYHQYGRTLNKLEDLRLRKNFRKEMTKGFWYWGKTGVGKSHKAFEDYSPETHYLLPNDNGWWDAYTQQDTVIINDFRGEIPYNQLLQLIDKWPMSVKRRNREPVPFTSKTIIITSSLPPEKIYHNRMNEDNIEQLLRRLVVEEIGTEVVGGNTEPLPETDEIRI